MYPVCIFCSHTRAEHAVSPNKDRPEIEFPCTVPNCNCTRYEPDTRDYVDSNLDSQKTTYYEIGQAEEPIEYRIMKAYLNGFSNGLSVGLNGGLDT